MRLIDADALPHSWQPDCNGSKWFVSGDDIEHAPTVCCEECAAFWGRRPCLTFDYAIADPRRFGCALFERRKR